MIHQILDGCPSFISSWETFQKDWEGEADLPIYIVLGELARHTALLVRDDFKSEYSHVFTTLESWLMNGDDYVRTAAKIGLLESMQNTSVVGLGMPERLEPFLSSMSINAWNELSEFWGNSSE